jgi:prophage tail gpP-like protein
MAMLNDIGKGGFLQAQVFDEGVTRFRKKVLIGESGMPGQDVALQRALWEKNRRWGRSFSLRVVTDSWRDSAGTLYTPNTLVDLNLPLLKCVDKTWLIGEVTYHLDGSAGTTCELTIMPPEAFSVEPQLLGPVWRDVPANPGAAAK